MSILHFSYASDGGASRAGRRASLACRMAGLASSFAFIEGKPVSKDDVRIVVAEPAAKLASAETQAQIALSETLHNRMQWEFIPDRRTSASNSLLSLPYPGADLSRPRVFGAADVLHLHWPTWGASPRVIADWLTAGRTVFWTLHDMWAMTGGCHYSAGCRQYETLCMKCPQLTEDLGLIGNAFDEKRRAYGKGGALVFVSPSQWLADLARRSTILGDRRIEVVRNPVELDVFKPCEGRARLRKAFGIGANDFALMMGSADLNETRKGVTLLHQAIAAAMADGSLPAALPKGAKVNLILIGKSSEFDPPNDVEILNLGEITEDDALADVLSIADVVVIPSLEDNHPNMIIEAMACGTPVIGYDAGGIAEMIEDEVTGLVVRPAGSVPRLKDSLLHFARSHFQSQRMRAACRAHAETHADPVRIGLQLRKLYEETLGRAIEPVSLDYHARMLAAFANAPVRPDARVGADMMRFPFNVAVLARAANPRTLARTVISPLPEAEAEVGRRSLITVRTYHEHHSARSGPYQFVRHLPKGRYASSHYAVPLGAGLVSKSSEMFRKAGALMGTSSFGQQGNGWLAEAEVLIACADRETDIVHFIDGDIAGMLLPSAPASIFKNGQRPVFVATYHQPEDVLKGMVNDRVLRRYDGLVALCGAQRDFLATLVPDDRVTVIPHGVDVEFFRPAEPGPRQADTSRPLRLLMVGHWLRDIKVALGAYKRLKETEFGFELRIVSPRFSANVSDPSITLLKGLSDEELREEYRTADLLYLPLIDATANNAVLEAMACGLPVVSTFVGGVPEAVGDEAGILCKQGDVEDFVSGVLELLRSPNRYAACSLAGRKRAEALSWVHIGERHHDFYRQLVEKRLCIGRERGRDFLSKTSI